MTENNLSYPERAFIAFNEIMASKKKNMLESVNRTNKGELFVLQFLATRNTEVLPSELSAAMRSSTARISALLGALEKKGQLVRNIDENNRRNILVTITPAGRSRVETEIEELKAVLIQIFTDMGETDTAEFIRLTARFFELMHKRAP